MGENGVLVVGLESGPVPDVLEGDGLASFPVWPGIGARHRSILRVQLGAEARTKLLCHPSDSVYYVLAGGGEVDDGAKSSQELIEGSMVHIDAGTNYRFRASSGGMTVFGGPCPPDPALYA